MSVGDEYSNTSTTSLQNHLLHNDNTIEETITINNTNNQASEEARNNNTTEGEVRSSTPRQEKETEINNRTKEIEVKGSNPKIEKAKEKAKNEFAKEIQNEVRGSSATIEEKEKNEFAKENQNEVRGSSPNEVEVRGSNPNPEKQNVETKEAQDENGRYNNNKATTNKTSPTPTPVIQANNNRPTTATRELRVADHIATIAVDDDESPSTNQGSESADEEQSTSIIPFTRRYAPNQIGVTPCRFFVANAEQAPGHSSDEEEDAIKEKVFLTR